MTNECDDEPVIGDAEPAARFGAIARSEQSKINSVGEHSDLGLGDRQFPDQPISDNRRYSEKPARACEVPSSPFETERPNRPELSFTNGYDRWAAELRGGNDCGSPGTIQEVTVDQVGRTGETP